MIPLIDSSHIRRWAVVIAFVASIRILDAGSATWSLHPTDNIWHTAANWIPATVPNAESDVASFRRSDTTKVTITKYGSGSNLLTTTLSKLVFEEGSPSYTVEVLPAVPYGVFLEIHGTGIINNSGVAQNLILAASGDYSQSAALALYSDASINGNVAVTNQGGASPDGDATYGAATVFYENTSASNATFINEGSTASGTTWGGFTDLLDYSSAESATFINNPGTVSGAAAGHTLVQIYAPGAIGNSTFINNGASVAGAEGGWTELDGAICAGASFIANGATVAGGQGGQVYTYGGAGYASFTAEGGTGTGFQGGLIDLWYVPASSQTAVTANGGSNGGLGGTILIEDSADIPLPQFQVFGKGVLDLSNVSDASMPIGSLAGDGLVLLAGHDLEVGHNDLDTTFSGVIQEEGSLSKAGLGALTLSGRNTYPGGTTVSGGVLVVNRSGGSGTGPGPVQVNAGTVGGNGTIAGTVTVGAGTGGAAFLAPAAGTKKQATLTIQSGITFNSGSTYTYTFKAKKNKARTDGVVANGVTIKSGASFAFSGIVQGELRRGTVFTVLNNTAATPIAGVFANLPDGAVLTVSGNNFQADYQGGDGNDVTLTVVP